MPQSSAEAARSAARSSAAAFAVARAKRWKPVDAAAHAADTHAMDAGRDADINLGADLGNATTDSDTDAHSDSGSAAPPRRRKAAPRRPKPLITDLHRLQPQRECPHACGALVWPGEGTVCCSAGKHILGPTFNPPISPAYLDFLKMEHISHDSRLLNTPLWTWAWT